MGFGDILPVPGRNDNVGEKSRAGFGWVMLQSRLNPFCKKFPGERIDTSGRYCGRSSRIKHNCPAQFACFGDLRMRFVKVFWSNDPVSHLPNVETDLPIKPTNHRCEVAIFRQEKTKDTLTGKPRLSKVIPVNS